jgi:hypothetical protein
MEGEPRRLPIAPLDTRGIFADTVRMHLETDDGGISEKRKVIRFSDVGRIDAGDICVFPGMLLDISESGCKSRFPYSQAFDPDCDYELRIYPAHKRNMNPFLLIGQPRWQKQNGLVTEIGFEFLHSPGARQLAGYLETLAKEHHANAEEMAIETVYESN